MTSGGKKTPNLVGGNMLAVDMQRSLTRAQKLGKEVAQLFGELGAVVFATRGIAQKDVGDLSRALVHRYADAALKLKLQQLDVDGLGRQTALQVPNLIHRCVRFRAALTWWAHSEPCAQDLIWQLQWATVQCLSSLSPQYES